jgi:HPr kinase/phosphorylase
MTEPDAETATDTDADTLVHGTCIALGTKGILMRGPSGAGKSDLALRMIEGGARLVSDDQVRLRLCDGGVTAFAPESIAGQIEVNGIGIIRLSPPQVVRSVPVCLVVDLVTQSEVVRFPTRSYENFMGLDIPRLALAPFEATAPTKLRLAAGSGPESIMSGFDTET